MARRGRHSLGRRKTRAGSHRIVPSVRGREARDGFALQAATALVVIGLAAVPVIAVFGRSAVEAPVRLGGGVSTTAPVEEGAIETLLVMGRDDSGAAAWLDLLSYDPATGTSSVVYIPAATAVEVPGRGLAGLGEALAGGNPSLVSLTTQMLLGIDVDHYLELTPETAAGMLASSGDLAIDVPTAVTVESTTETTELFSEGTQTLAPADQADLLFAMGADGDQAELGTRHLAFWDALLAEGSDGLAVGIMQGTAGSDLAPAELAAFLSRLQTADPDLRTVASLPVEQQLSGEAELYSPIDSEIAGFVQQTTGAVPTESNDIQVQVLDGVGADGAGQGAAARLLEGGFELVLSGDAETFGQPVTRIVAYSTAPEAREAAEQARELLGLGEVQVSAQQQGIVDLTIVVGRDFIDAAKQGGESGA